MAIPTALEKTCFPQHNISHFSINKLWDKPQLLMQIISYKTWNLKKNVFFFISEMIFLFFLQGFWKFFFIKSLRFRRHTFYMSRRSLLGSSTTSLMRRKKNTASLPSMSLWSYVRAMYIIGLGTTLPPTTTGRETIECIPKIADCKEIEEEANGVVQFLKWMNQQTHGYQIQNVLKYMF